MQAVFLSPSLDEPNRRIKAGTADAAAAPVAGTACAASSLTRPSASSSAPTKAGAQGLMTRRGLPRSYQSLPAAPREESDVPPYLHVGISKATTESR